MKKIDQEYKFLAEIAVWSGIIEGFTEIISEVTSKGLSSVEKKNIFPFFAKIH